MTKRTRIVLGRSVFVVEIALLLVLITLMIGNVPTYRAFGQLDPTDAYLNFLFPLMGLAYVSIGVVIVTRAGSVLGWLLCAVGLGLTLAQYSDTYTLYTFVTSPDSLPAPRVVAVSQVFFGLGAAAVGPIFLLFPDGRVPGPRWRPLLWVVPTVVLLATINSAVRPGLMGGIFNDFGIRLMNPIGVPIPRGISEAIDVAALVGVFGTAACAVSLVVRYRRSSGDERQQIRWLAYVGAGTLLFLLLGFASNLILPDGGISEAIWIISFLPPLLTLGLGIPTACAVAVLRYRLYDLDLVVKKTVVFTVIAVFITVLYVAALALAAFSTVGAIAGALIFVLTFNMVRRRARKVADRLVYGKRATPFEVMSDFSERVGETYSVDDVLPRMTELLAGSTGASEARVWLRSETRLIPVAASPADAPSLAAVTLADEDLPTFVGDLSAFPVTHQGELLGAITLRMPPNDPMDPSKERLVHGLASQAGLALRNVALVQDLRESRRRIVAAQDERAKALERNIHDGAQQQLVALAVKLRLAQQLVDRDAAKAQAILGELQTDATDALENLRDLARGIYPPLLADKGLVAALEAQGRKSPVPVEVVPDGVARYAPEVEATVYFCCLEALGNIAKYANASRVQIRLDVEGPELRFVVHDDGVGFDPAAHRDGTGLQGMRDRLSALGGTLSVQAEPGAGATISGSLPAGPHAPNG